MRLLLISLLLSTSALAQDLESRARKLFTRLEDNQQRLSAAGYVAHCFSAFAGRDENGDETEWTEELIIAGSERQIYLARKRDGDWSQTIADKSGFYTVSADGTLTSLPFMSYTECTRPISHIWLIDVSGLPCTGEQSWTSKSDRSGERFLKTHDLDRAEMVSGGLEAEWSHQGTQPVMKNGVMQEHPYVSTRTFRMSPNTGHLPVAVSSQTTWLGGLDRVSTAAIKWEKKGEHWLPSEIKTESDRVSGEHVLSWNTGMPIIQELDSTIDRETPERLLLLLESVEVSPRRNRVSLAEEAFGGTFPRDPFK